MRHSAEIPTLKAGVVIDTYPGKQRHFLSAEAGTRRLPP
jgi:hypothetical protein